MSEADAINAVLQDLHLSQSFYCRCELGAPWGLSLPRRDFARFHFVAEGSCWLQCGAGVTQLTRGDLVLLPYGQGHLLLSAPGALPAPIDSLPHESRSERSALLRYGGDGARATVLCGGIRFAPKGHPLLEALPEALFLRSQEHERSSQARSLLEMMANEATQQTPGGATMMTRLAELLVLEAIRGWLVQSVTLTGWLHALRDPQLGAAIALIHRKASHPWTVDSLAAAVGVSRALFCKRFQEVVGVAPMKYLTKWRMQLAQHWMRTEQLSLAAVATKLGYSSEASFSRAFKRHVGIPPGAARSA